MAVDVLITDRKIFDPLKNGEDYLSNTGDFATHQAGNVMDNPKRVIEIDVSWQTESSSSKRIKVSDGGTGAGNICKLIDVGSFIIDGFSVGDTFDFQGDLVALGREITGMSNDGSTLTFDGGVLGELTSANIQVRGTTPLTSLIYSYGIIENSDSRNFKSILDDSDQTFYITDIGIPPGGPRGTSLQTGIPQGTVKGWVTGDVKVAYDSNPSTYVQRFVLEHDYIIIPYYQEGDETNINAGINPDLLLGNKSLKFVARLEFRTTLSNINTRKIGFDDLQFGDVGGFDENFNGFDPNYTLKSIAYEDDATALASAGIIVDKTTKVTVRITRSIGTFTAADPVVVHHSFLPQEAGYTNNTDDFKTVWFYELKRQLIAAGAVDGTIVTGLTVTIISPTEIEIIHKIAYSAAQQAQLSDTNLYMLAYNVGDPSLTTVLSDKVMVKGQLRAYVKNSDIPDLIILDKFNIFNHPQNITGGTAFSSIEGWPEDGIVIDFRAHMDITKESVITGCRQRFVAFNPSDGDIFELDSFDLALDTSVIVPTGVGTEFVQKLNLDTIRGFQIPDDDQFNAVILKSDILTGDDQFYNLTIGFKVPWQDWLALLVANRKFYDVTKPNDGLNLNASNYNLLFGYELRAFIEFDILNSGVTTNYIFSSASGEIRNYDDDGDTPGDFVGTISRRTVGGFDIGTNVLTGADTIFRVTWSHDAPFSSVADFWVVHSLEEVNSPSANPSLVSSERANRTDTILLPKTGESFLTKVLGTGPDTGKLITECRINKDLVDLNKTYKFSARIGTKSGLPPFSNCIKFEEDGITPKVEEDGITLKRLENCTDIFFGW